MTKEFILIISIISIIGFSVALFVETSAWCVRSRSHVFTQGLFNSRANIYLYCARAFMIIFLISMSLLIDKGVAGNIVVFIIAISLTASMAGHILFRSSVKLNKITIDVLLKLLFLHGVGIVGIKNQKKSKSVLDFNLLRNTAVSTIILTFGVVSPFLIAQKYPDIRMTISAVGQFVNAFGTILLLFKVDPILYRGMDEGTLISVIDTYVDGRALGLVIATVLAWLSLAIICFFEFNI